VADSGAQEGRFLDKKKLSHFRGLLDGIEREAFVSKTDHAYLIGREVLAQEIIPAGEETARNIRPELGSTDFEGELEIHHWVIEVMKKAQFPHPGRIFVGRGEENDICIPHATVSNSHAYFTRDTYIVNRWFLVDMDSANGTRTNGLRLTPRSRVALLDEDTVCLGQCAFQWLIPGSFYDRVMATGMDTEAD
jgi:hypothetical protein